MSRRLPSPEAAARLATELGEEAVCLPTFRSNEIRPEYFFKGPFLFLSFFRSSCLSFSLNGGYTIGEGSCREDENIKTFVFLA